MRDHQLLLTIDHINLSIFAHEFEGCSYMSWSNKLKGKPRKSDDIMHH